MDGNEEILLAEMTRLLSHIAPDVIPADGVIDLFWQIDNAVVGLVNALRPFAIECPFIFDEATISRKGIDAAPEQVVVNMSVGWLRIVKAREALGIKTDIP